MLPTKLVFRGLHYTPVELIHLTLDPVFEGLAGTARVIDPSCGSGAFLVESFRRLVWRRTQNKPADRRTVRDVLYNQLYGIDVNPSALGIAAFSLYLAALELDEEPISRSTDFRFEKLVNRSLFEADAISALPVDIARGTFDAAVGNPPWTFVSKKTGQFKTLQKASGPPRPRRSPDQEFLAKACELVKEGSGRVGMIMKATPFFSKDSQAIEARNYFLERLSPVALVNLSSLRKEGLFPDATGPALVFFARCPLQERKDQTLVGSVPWTPAFRRNGIFQIGPADLHSVSLKRLLRNPALLKAAAFGTTRDMLLMERLRSSFHPLDDFLSEVGIAPLSSRGQGFKVEGPAQFETPKEYRSLKVLRAADYTPFRVNTDVLPSFTYRTLHRPRTVSIFRAPLLICPKASFAASPHPGRVSAAVSLSDVLYTQSFYGISFARSQTKWAYVLNAILNSSLATFQLVFGGATWGLERPTIEPNDLLSLRVPDLRRIDPVSLREVLFAERSASRNSKDRTRLEALDEAVFDLYQLDRDDRVVARDSFAKARAMIFDGRAKYEELVSAPSEEDLTLYAKEVVRTINAFLRTSGTRHLEGYIYRELSSESRFGAAGLTAVHFIMAAGAPRKEPMVHIGSGTEFAQFAKVLNTLGGDGSPPYLNERREMRIYGPSDVLIVKPAEIRYWTMTLGLSDADLILSDHWLPEQHAAVS